MILVLWNASIHKAWIELFILGVLKTTRPVGSTPESCLSGTLTELDAASLRVHPLNRQLYTEEPLEGLIESVQEHGVLVPLLVTEERLVVSGHRRLQAALKADHVRIPAIVLPAKDESDLVRLLLEANRQRVKSTEERLREFREYLRLEHMSAKARQGARTDLATDLVESFPQGARGKARDLAAAKVGLSGKSAVKGLEVIEAIDARGGGGDMHLVDEVRNRLNRRGIDGAYKRAVELGWLKPAASGASHTAAQANVAVATPLAPLPAPALATEEGSPAPKSPDKDIGMPIRVQPNVSSCLAEAGSTDGAGESSGAVVTLTALPLTPEVLTVDHALPSNLDPWIMPSRLDAYLTERHQQNATAPLQLILSESAQAMVETFTRDLAKLINRAMVCEKTSPESSSLVSALKKSLVWFGTELSTQTHVHIAGCGVTGRATALSARSTFEGIDPISKPTNGCTT